jgi:hypothetical protein
VAGAGDFARGAGELDLHRQDLVGDTRNVSFPRISDTYAVKCNKRNDLASHSARLGYGNGCVSDKKSDKPPPSPAPTTSSTA